MASNDIDPKVLEVVEKETAALVEAGAEAVYMTGSWARGDAHPESDIDLRVVGEGDSPHLKRSGSFLISTSWQTEDEQGEGFEDPGEVGSVVPGWRSAVILHDPEGTAARLKKRAEEWHWGLIEDECNRWVAAQVTDYAEEIHTLVKGLDEKNDFAAAAERSQIAMNLVQFLSVHRRLLYESENDLWDDVADEMGEHWADLQRTALVADSDLRTSSRAAMDMFLLAAHDVRDLLDDTQREVVAHACELAGGSLGES